MGLDIPSTLILEDILQSGMTKALDLGATDFAAVGSREFARMIRFTDNSVTLSTSEDTSNMHFYIGYKKRRLIGSIDLVDRQKLLEEIENIIKHSENIEPSKEYVKLPSGLVDYTIPIEKKQLGNDEIDDIVDTVEGVINTGLKHGAKRVAGTLKTSLSKMFLITSGKRSGKHITSNTELNIRAFNKDGSGHGVALSTNLKDLEWEKPAKKAGEMAKRSRRGELVKAGKYNCLLSRVVMGDLISSAGSGLSAFYVDSGLSPFKDKIGKQIANKNITISDDPDISDNPVDIPFDFEGVPRKKTIFVQNGKLKTYCHNGVTAKKYSVESTGHAGYVVPMPYSLVVEPGQTKSRELLKELKNGIYFTNTWYTRFQNYSTGEFSTIARDAAFLVEDGEIVKPLKGARISDSIPRILKQVKQISKERSWVKWWEFETPCLMPDMLVDEVNVTTGYNV